MSKTIKFQPFTRAAPPQPVFLKLEQNGYDETILVAVDCTGSRISDDAVILRITNEGIIELFRDVKVPGLQVVTQWHEGDGRATAYPAVRKS